MRLRRRDIQNTMHFRRHRRPFDVYPSIRCDLAEPEDTRAVADIAAAAPSSAGGPVLGVGHGPVVPVVAAASSLHQ